MTAPTVDDFPTLGFVPCPGDHHAVTSVVATLKRTTDALGEVVRVLRGADKGTWRGKTADAFREILSDDFRPKVEKALTSFAEARGALDDWADHLARYQARARHLEERAHAAKKSADASDRDNPGQRGKAGGSSGGADDDNGKDHVEELRAEARRLHSAFESQGADIARRLQHAGDIAPDEPGFWDKLGDKIGGALSEIGEAIKENADWITVAASVIGVAAIFFPALAPVAFALSAVALVAHGAKYGSEGLWPPSKDKIGNYLTLGGDALGAIPGFGAAAKGVGAGVRAARGVPGAAAGLKVGISAGARGANFAARAANPALPLISRPVEAAATRLGASAVNAQRIADGVQATGQLAWTAPTAYAAARPSDGAANAANWGTAIGNVAAGSGGGRFGGIAGLGSAIGLGVWETR
ncbi:putative T7SS-secreted protein [Streptomyces sp. NPDC001922]|uniref:putative T7SS-secreted protein n=1 Tax=Streptomyces sp. NPDC001922 TaxID=3364624 RepID=UPI0036B074CA